MKLWHVQWTRPFVETHTWLVWARDAFEASEAKVPNMMRISGSFAIPGHVRVQEVIG